MSLLAVYKNSDIVGFSFSPNDYIEEKIMNNETAPEVKMWKAVIAQAVKDAYSFDSTAISWIENKDEHSEMVFSFADIDRDRAIESMKAMLVFLSKSICRGKRPKLDKERVRWVKPSKAEKEKALRFIKSPRGKEYIAEVDPDFLVEAKTICESVEMLETISIRG